MSTEKPSIAELEATLDRAREACESFDMRILTDQEIREYVKGDMDLFTRIRFEEMHMLLKVSGLITEDEYRSGPNYSTLTAAAERIRASRGRPN
jgi:hypothetical protein